MLIIFCNGLNYGEFIYFWIKINVIPPISNMQKFVRVFNKQQPLALNYISISMITLSIVNSTKGKKKGIRFHFWNKL